MQIGVVNIISHLTSCPLKIFNKVIYQNIFNKVEIKAITHPKNKTRGHENGIFKDELEDTK